MTFSRASILSGALATTLVAVSAIGQVPGFVTTPAWPLVTQGPFLVDLDNDGHPEVLEPWVLLSAQPGVSLSYRRLLGNGEWAAGPSFTSPAFAQFTGHLIRAAGDVDGDGNSDVYVNRTISGQGSPGPGANPFRDLLWLGDGTGGLSDGSHLLPSTPTNSTAAEFADFDGDGDLDLVICDVSGLLLWINDGSGAFTDESFRIPNNTAYEPWRCAVFDADHDGDLDVLVANGWGTFEPTVLYENGGNAWFRAHSQTQAVTRIADLHLVDADGDGHDDVVAVYPTLTTVFLSRPNQTQMTLAPHLLPPVPTGTEPYYCFVIDGDGDGDRDLAVKRYGGNTFEYWQNTGSGFVVTPNVLPPTTGVRYVIDYDHDGDEDLFGSVVGVNSLVWLSNTSRELVRVTDPIRGAMFTHDVYARANHVVALGISTHYLRQPFGALGLLYLDPAQTATIALLTFPTRGRQTVSIAIPNLPWLVGQELCVQGVDVDLTAGTMHLTNAPAATVQ